MTIAELAELPEIGVGVVHTPMLAQRLSERLGELVVEVEPQASWQQVGADAFTVPQAEYAELRARAGAVLVHGNGDPLGGTIDAGPGFADAFAMSVATLQPAWVSEHLAFGRYAAADGVHAIGLLLPPVQTEAAIAIAAARIDALAQRLGRTIAIEPGVSYLRPQPWELPDGEFVASVAEAADAALVLDLHNVYANALNRREALDDCLAALPLDRVVEIHLAGGLGYHGYWLDAHCGPTPVELRALAEMVVPWLPNLKAIVFEIHAQYDGRLDDAALDDELAWLHALWARRGDDAGIRPRRRSAPVRVRDAPEPELWESTLGDLVRGRPRSGALARMLGSDPAIGLCRSLVARRRRHAIESALPWTMRALRCCDGPQAGRAVLDELLRKTSPEPFASTEALRFADALAHRTELDPLIRDALAIERASLRARVEGITQHVDVEHDPHELFDALAHDRRPLRGRVIRVELTP